MKKNLYQGTKINIPSDKKIMIQYKNKISPVINQKIPLNSQISASEKQNSNWEENWKSARKNFRMPENL